MQDRNVLDHVQPVILAGGAGTRLWPLSRALHPKQFQPLTGGGPMLGETLARLEALPGAAVERAPPLVVCHEEHRFLVAELLRARGEAGATVLLEPVARNTAPAIALAAFEVVAAGDDPLLLILPADHALTDADAFAEAVVRGLPQAAAGHLVAFGVRPTYAETGYGYIRTAGGAGDGRIDRFIEKPDSATAERYLAAGDHYWNSGMFLFRASAILAALEAHAPALRAAVAHAHAGRRSDLDFIRPDITAFTAIPADSIDYAVMEHTSEGYLVELDAGWSDIGSWAAVHAHAARAGTTDAGGNAVQGDVRLHAVEGSLVHAGHRLVAAVGVNDLVIVETADAVLVAHRDRAQDIRAVADGLRAEGRSEAALHRRVYRPWGSYEGVDCGERFQVKRIVVKPGGHLSLQKHHHRAEHWVVVRGTAEVTRGEDVVLLAENESTYIPLGLRHRLRNPGHIPLELIEVQSGSYLGEDDIVRYDDQYGRDCAARRDA